MQLFFNIGNFKTIFIIINTLNLTLGDTPSFSCLGCDSILNAAKNELHDIYNYDSPESLVTICNKRRSQVRDHIRQVSPEYGNKQYSQSKSKRSDIKFFQVQEFCSNNMVNQIK